MKKLFFLSILTVCFFQNSYSQIDQKYLDVKDNNYSYIIKFSPYSTFWGSVPLTGEYGLSVEYKAGIKSSIELKAAYVGKGLLYLSMEPDLYTSSEPHLTMTGYRFQADYRFYFNRKDVAKGLFAAPLFSFTSVNFSDDLNKPLGNYIKVNHIEYAAIAGYHLIARRFSLEAYIGIKYRQRHWVENYLQNITILTEAEMNDMYVITTPFLPTMGFTIGSTF